MRITALLLGLWLAVGVAGCGGGGAPSEDEKGALAVTVNRGGAPVQDALVVAEAARGRAPASPKMASSDASGVARLSGLPAGTYTVTASRSVGSDLFAASGGVLVVSAGAVSTASLDLSDAGPDYLPLALGNEWTYDSLSLAVQTTKRIHSVNAFALARSGGGRPFYFARGVNEVYCLGMQRAGGTDEIYWPPVVFFSTVLGEDVSALGDWGTVTVISRDATVGVPAGQFSNCITLALAHDGIEERWYLAPGVGPCMIEIYGLGGAVARLTNYVLH